VDATWEEIAAPLEQHARHLIAGRPIRFERSAAPLRATTDPKLLGEALLNLVRNAIEAVGEQGEVHLAATAQGSALRISVTDNGPGLDPAVRRRLFEPFQTTKADGTGLGLSIARKLVESLGGTLRLEDAAPRGARAVVDLPRARVQS
jgi:two-component system sensor histidine kinase FlrB